MPLPAALLAKLAKRGILSDENKERSEIIKKRQAEEEEVIAESYDEPTDPSKENKSSSFNCPNRFNQFHECNNFCLEKYGNKKFEHHPIMEKRRARMLKIYPLPANWLEVPDFNTNRYYYWNTETDQVCWISPAHPKAKIEYAKKPKAAESSFKPASRETKSVDFSKSEERPSRDEKYKHGKKFKPKDDTLDPMDPASYSDVPRGKWSAGLDGDQ